MSLENVTITCFAASYSVALLLELIRLRYPSDLLRVATLTTVWLGIFAHTIYLFLEWQDQQLLGSGLSSLLFLTWILTIFYLYGTYHHRKLAWGIFVLPVIVGLSMIAWFTPSTLQIGLSVPDQLQGFLWLHFALLVLGAVGLCVSFMASVMYLVQSYRLRHKIPPREGVQLFSLEKLERMNRRGIIWSFPLFTAGLIIGFVLLGVTAEFEWWDPKVIAAGLLWIAFLVLLFLRYGLHEQGRRVAWGTIFAFGLLLIAFGVHLILPSAHDFRSGR